MPNATEQFTPRLLRVCLFAQEEAQVLASPGIGTEHLLLALVRESDGIAGQVLARRGIMLSPLRVAVRGMIRKHPPPQTSGLAPDAQAAIAAGDEAARCGQGYVGTEHLLLGMLGAEDSSAIALLRRFGIAPRQVQEDVERILASPGYADGSTPAHGEG